MTQITERQIQLVQTTWAKIVPHFEFAANVFYKKLFKISPELQSLFKKDREEQKQLLMSMITMAVNSLHQPDYIVPAFEALGRRHKEYGVKKADYQFFWMALFSMLRAGLREEFTSEIKEAWREVFDFMASAMVQQKITMLVKNF